MIITGSVLAFFNDTCGRHDTAIQVSQTNDDGQFPITISATKMYNISENNTIFNGKPNVERVNPNACGGKIIEEHTTFFKVFSCLEMDCDGLKKILIINPDGSAFPQPSTLFSQSEALWSQYLY